MKNSIQSLAWVVMLLVVAPLAHAQKASTKTSSPPPPSSQLTQQIQKVLNDSAEDCTVKQEPHKPVGRTTIYVRQNRTVTIRLQADETVSSTIWEQAAPGELVDEFVHPDERTVTVRLKSVGALPGVIATTKRTYFLLLSPSDVGTALPCYQGFIFQSNQAGGVGINPFGGTTIQSTGVNATSVSEAYPQTRPDDTVFTGAPNFNYVITGPESAATIRPTAVYDNGRWTWIQMGKAQAVPAVIYIGPNGPEIVNYSTINGGSTLLVNRLMDKFVLKLGQAEISVTADRR